MKHISVILILVLSTLVQVSCTTQPKVQEELPPNFVVIFLDDSGYSDFQPFGNPAYPTPHVDQLASEGTRFTQFYVPQAVCSASRASLLTGCYPGRTKIFGAHPPRAKGLDPSFATLAEVLQSEGYATASFGKWHLGDQEGTRPPDRGFMESSGLMYSNDMWKFHPGTRVFDTYPLQFWKNGEIQIEDMTPDDQKHLTRWYTEHAVDFINRHAGEPFFLYVPHSMPHVPLYCSDAFDGKSGAGLYGDVMMEIDWSVGQIMAALEESGTARRTVVLFTSDNGPWISYGDHAGQTPFREAKSTSFDGGIRSACIVRYPGITPAGEISSQSWSTLDILPTFANLAGANLPENPIDGMDVGAVLENDPGFRNPHAYYAFSTGRNLEAVITGNGKWKLHQPHNYRTLQTPGENGNPGQHEKLRIGWALYDMEADPMETENVIEQFPEVAERLKTLITQHKERFYGD